MADDANSAADELRRLEAAVDRFREAMPGNRIGNQSTITLNAGGVGVWIAVSACAVMLAVNMALLALIIAHDRKIDNLQHYVNAIYMMAPHLKPEDK